MQRDIVVVGASTGGIDALKTLVAGLPEDYAGSLFVVVHTAADAPGVLPWILQRAGPLPTVAVHSRQEIRQGCIYVAVPDHHLVLERGVVRATRGPKENRFRPAVDPLFRSAARAYGPRAVGIVLTGGLDDGTGGLWAIKQQGGLAIVQDPAEAIADSMPRSALRHVEVDHCLRLAEMAPLLVRLSAEGAEPAAAEPSPRLKIEVDIARERPGLEAGVERLGTPSIYACPDCHGVLLQLQEGDRLRFRCHTGHAYSMDSLLADMEQRADESLWKAVRALQAKMLLLRHFVRHAAEGGNEAAIAALQERAGQAEQRLEQVRQAAFADEPAPTGD